MEQMPGNFKNGTFKVWTENNLTRAEVRFPENEYDTIFAFRNVLMHQIRKDNDHCLLKRKNENPPESYGSYWLLFEKNNYDSAVLNIKEFDKGEEGRPPMPNEWGELFRSKVSRTFQAWCKKRDQEWESSVVSLSLFVVRTTYEYPLVECYSRMHDKDQLTVVLKNAAKELGIALARGD